MNIRRRFGQRLLALTAFLACVELSSLSARELPVAGLRAEKRAIVASCSGDKRYGSETTIRIAAAVERGGEWISKVSFPFPPFWDAKQKAVLLGAFHSGVVVIHFSCFERNPEDENIPLRDSTFLRFLEDMRDEPSVKILVYSRVFERYPEYLVDLLRRERTTLCEAYRGRLAILPVRRGLFPGESEEANKDLRAKLDQLWETPPAQGFC